MGRRPNLQLIQLISREVYTDPFVLCMTQNKMLIYVADRTHAYQKKILDEHEKKLGMARDEYHRKLWKERDRERLKFNPSPDSRYKYTKGVRVGTASHLGLSVPPAARRWYRKTFPPGARATQCLEAQILQIVQCIKSLEPSRRTAFLDQFQEAIENYHFYAQVPPIAAGAVPYRTLPDILFLSILRASSRYSHRLTPKAARPLHAGIGNLRLHAA